MGSAVKTALGTAKNDAKLSIGESVVVFVVGGVGHCLIQDTVLSSAYTIIALGIKNDKLAMA